MKDVSGSSSPVQWVVVILVLVGAFVAVSMLSQIEGAIVVRPVDKAALGVRCTFSSDCASALCVERYCRERDMLAGRKCLDDRQCASGRCSQDVCAARNELQVLQPCDDGDVECLKAKGRSFGQSKKEEHANPKAFQ